MELKSYGHILRNKVLFNWATPLRPLVYRFYPKHEAPIFVLGNQKSGTSAVAALLARATGLSYDIDLGGLRTPQYDTIYSDRTQLGGVLANRAGVEISKGLVKEPNLTFLLPELRSLYPRSRYAFVIRHPYANIRSILNRLKLPGDLASIDVADYPEISPMWEAILYNRWVGDTGQPLNYVGRSAERWRVAASIYLASGPETQLIKYEDFNASKLAAIAGLAERLKLPIKYDISPYLDVQYQRAGEKITDYASFFGTRNLATVQQQCEPVVGRLGYAL